jgi:hypothetical protein
MMINHDKYYVFTFAVNLQEALWYNMVHYAAKMISRHKMPWLL